MTKKWSKFKAGISMLTVLMLILSLFQITVAPAYADTDPNPNASQNYVTLGAIQSAGGYTMEASYMPTNRGYENLYRETTNLLSNGDEFTIRVKVQAIGDRSEPIEIKLPSYDTRPLVTVSTVDGQGIFDFTLDAQTPAGIKTVLVTAKQTDAAIGETFDLTIRFSQTLNTVFNGNYATTQSLFIGDKQIRMRFLRDGIDESVVTKNSQLAFKVNRAGGSSLKGIELTLHKYNKDTLSWEKVTDLSFAEDDQFSRGLKPDNAALSRVTSSGGMKYYKTQLEPRSLYKIALKGIVPGVPAEDSYPGLKLSELPEANFVVDENGVAEIIGGSHVSPGTYWGAKVTGGGAFKLVKTDQDGVPLSGVEFNLEASVFSYGTTATAILGTFCTNDEGVLINTKTNHFFIRNTETLMPLSEENRDKVVAVWDPATQTYRQEIYENIFTVNATPSYVLREVVDPDKFPYQKAADFVPMEIHISEMSGAGTNAAIMMVTGNGISVKKEMMYYDNYTVTENYFALYTITAKNNLIVNYVQPEIQLYKQDKSTNTPLPDVGFSIYALDDSYGRVTPNTPAATITTGAEGKTEVLRNLPAGKYEILETNTPSGYSTDTASLSHGYFNINDHGNVSMITEKTNVNISVEKDANGIYYFTASNVKEDEQPVVKELALYKQDKDSKAPLSGVGFSIYKVNDSYARVTPDTADAYIETKANGKTDKISMLAAGKYEILETKTPTGYKTDAASLSHGYFTVDSQGNVAMDAGRNATNISVAPDGNNVYVFSADNVKKPGGGNVTPPDPGTPGGGTEEPPKTPEEPQIPDPETPTTTTPEGIRESVPPGGHLEKTPDGGYVVIGQAGVPLGKWHQEPDGVWIFEEYVPMTEVPETGTTDPILYLLIFIGASVVFSTYGYAEMKKRMWENRS